FGAVHRDRQHPPGALKFQQAIAVRVHGVPCGLCAAGQFGIQHIIRYITGMETLAARMSARSQTILVWWALIFMAIYAAAFIGLLKMVPPPPATLPPEAVASFYARNALSIRLGAVIASWTSAFAVPLAVVISVQLARLEKGP